MDIALQVVFIPGAWVERSFTRQGDLVALPFPSPRRLVLVLAWIMNVLGLKKVLLNKSPFRGGGEAFPRHVSLAQALKDSDGQLLVWMGP